MRKAIAFLLILALLLLPGCGDRAPKNYTLNPDGTIGDLRWGMTFHEAARAEKSIADLYPGITFLGSQPMDKSTMRIRLPDGEFPGAGTHVVELYFQRISKERKNPPPLRLTEIHILVIRKTEDAVLADWAGACLTLMEPTAINTWTSAGTLGDRVSRDVLREAFPYNTEAFIDSLCGKALYTVTASADSTRLITNGYYQALAVALEE